jgi:ribosome-binding factor A
MIKYTHLRENNNEKKQYSIRQKMVGKNILKALSHGLRTQAIHCKDLNTNIITITEVCVAANLLNANVYFAIFGDEKQQKKQMSLLETMRKTARQYLSKQINIRKIPELHFAHDRSGDEFNKINNILQNQIQLS